jgi:hypothetical protein
LVTNGYSRYANGGACMKGSDGTTICGYVSLIDIKNSC